jgi:hypothetical protein
MADRGVVYAAFGRQAQGMCMKSVFSLRRHNRNLPVVVVGDMPMTLYGAKWTRWPKEVSVYNPKRKQQFQFESGIVRPRLYDFSPFEQTLYLDVDTEIRGSLDPGFDFLSTCDLAMAQHTHPLDYYVKSRGRSKPEWITTIEEFGGGSELYINSGVIFWKKNDLTKEVFRLWHEEWLRFPNWNEQLSLMRAIRRVDGLWTAYINRRIWNTNRPTDQTVIFHNYGKGTASRR